VKAAPWLDHLPPWLAWGAIASTGAYAPGELALMALPLLAGAVAQGRGWALEGWRRGLELMAVAALLVLLLLRLGVLMTVVYMLFLLCGVRLCLPRAVPQRRQLLMMGFLLFLTTAVTTADLDFLLWSLAWAAGAAALLLQLNWEKSAQLRQGPYLAAPHARVLPWSLAALVMGSGFFVLLPRLRMGLSHLPASVQGVGGLQTGLSDVLDLSGLGPIQTNREVAMRILPARGLSAQARQDYASAMGLLRGFALERLDGQRWEMDPDTPRRGLTRWTQGLPPRPVLADLFMGPELLGVIPLPYGETVLEPPPGEALRFGRGASLRWVFPVRRTTALRMALDPAPLEQEPAPRGARLSLLTDTGQGTGSARDWSLRAVPAALPPRELAERLTRALRTSFRYTLDNPSGAASNPLQDFLEHSRAGECEYFASALAFMLRHRGVPARVAVGYRLGPWIDGGGYFLVTQAQAHSWVEYYDPDARGWRSADPTPAAPPGFETGPFLAALTRWGDIVRFSWDRDVVRFSDEDQLAGAGWALGRFQAMGRWRPGPAPRILAGLAILAALGWFGGRPLARRWGGAAPGPDPGRIRQLRPLLRKARGTLPPLHAETARAWLVRLARKHPHRAAQLERLAREADAVAYGRKPGGTLKALAREEARRWRS
jgi:hypothetical protein